MTFEETPIPGAWLVGLEQTIDERGFFARLFCSDEFAERGLATEFAQISDSLSTERGTLRGMHYQAAPAEAKLVRCIRGSIFDVAIDLRADSPTFKQWFSVELSAENRLMVYVPEGCAHGFLTLEADTELLYFITAPYQAEYQRGVRWDDPAFAIDWPTAPALVSVRDRSFPDFEA
jgi:dTDP-4-dehydrorhamnose 3,5-epimerase